MSTFKQGVQKVCKKTVLNVFHWRSLMFFMCFSGRSSLGKKETFKWTIYGLDAENMI